jgi:hypothetical protein
MAGTLSRTANQECTFDPVKPEKVDPPDFHDA